MKSVQKGFTLIELMIVIAIIGILAAIAIPAYQNYVIRAQVSEGPSLIGGLEAAFDENYANTGTAAASNPAVGIAASSTIQGTYVTSAKLTAAGQITVMYDQAGANAAIKGDTVIWTAYKGPNGDITWVCNAHAVPGGETAVGTAETAGTITNGSYLPTICQ